MPLPAAACCCLLLPAAASAGVCCCLLLPAAAMHSYMADPQEFREAGAQKLSSMLSLLLLLLLLPLLLLLVRLNLLVFACLIPWRAPPCVCRGRRMQSNSLQSKKQTARHPFRNTSETAKHHLISCPKRSKGTPKKGLTSLLKPYYKIATLPLPAAACCCLLLPAAASAGVCCAAACCCLC